MNNYFLWEPSSLGQVASIWHDILTDGNGKARVTLTPLVPLLEGDTRSIEELKRAYPYEKI